MVHKSKTSTPESISITGKFYAVKRTEGLYTVVEVTIDNGVVTSAVDVIAPDNGKMALVKAQRFLKQGAI